MSQRMQKEKQCFNSERDMRGVMVLVLWREETVSSEEFITSIVQVLLHKVPLVDEEKTYRGDKIISSQKLINEEYLNFYF